jgi:hypothetical protein
MLSGETVIMDMPISEIKDSTKIKNPSKNCSKREMPSFWLTIMNLLKYKI